VLTSAELPEARALIPVMKDKKQMGTIIVSITDGVFDYRNPEHLEIARAIETRLVDQDLLPTWAQMMRPAS
jgi:Immunity protein 52